VRPKLLLTIMAALLLAACDSSGPPTATPAPAATSTPRPWSALPTPPPEISKSKPDLLVNLTHEQGATLFPVRVLSRAAGSRSGFLEAHIPEIVVTIEMKNNTSHDIERVSGPLLLHDANGEEIDSARIEETPAIKAGVVITRALHFTDTDSMPSRKKLKEVPLEQLSAEFRPLFISYSDGTGQEIQYTR
jgi:hypothetical protein